MKYRYLTGTGCNISRLSLGTMNFGNQVDEAGSIRLIHKAMDEGINFIDTADIYNKGLTETIVGKALKGKRKGIVLASKVRYFVGEYERDRGLNRWHIIHGVEASLKRLNTDCLDICYLHNPDYDTPLEESLAATDYLVRKGMVMYVGMSNYAAWQICQAKWICDRRNMYAPVVAQNVYNMITRGMELEFIPFCKDMKVGITAYNPLASGMLTGKYDPSKSIEPGTRFDFNKEHYKRYWNDANIKAVAELSDIAAQAGIKPAVLALKWLIAQEAIDSIVIGVSRVEQLEENLSALEGELDKDILAACDNVWEKIKGKSFRYCR